MTKLNVHIQYSLCDLAIIHLFLCLVELAFVSGSNRVNEDVGIASIPVMVTPASLQQITVRAVSSTGGSATGILYALVIQLMCFTHMH